MRWFITGATGFVGGAVAARLIEHEDEVTVYVRNPHQLSPLLRDSTTVVEGSLGNPTAIRDAARGAEVVLHAAAVHDHGAATQALRWVNVAGTENVLRASTAAGVRRMVYVSCADVTLSNVDRVHWDEDRLLGGDPIDEHARSKRLAEELVLAESGPKIETIAIRPPLVWGPGDRSHLPDLVDEALRNDGIALVGRGENLVSVVYVDHLVDTVVAAATRGTPGRAYYVTDNEFLEAGEFYRLVSDAAGVSGPRRGLPLPIAYGLAWARTKTSRAGLSQSDIVHRGRPTFFNIQGALTDLGYEPRISIAEGMDRLREWIQSEGGPKALAAQRQNPASAASVDEMVAQADAWSAEPSHSATDEAADEGPA